MEQVEIGIYDASGTKRKSVRVLYVTKYKEPMLNYPDRWYVLHLDDQDGGGSKCLGTDSDHDRNAPGWRTLIREE